MNSTTVLSLKLRIKVAVIRPARAKRVPWRRKRGGIQPVRSMDGQSTNNTLPDWNPESNGSSHPLTDSWLAELHEATNACRDVVLADQRDDGSWSNDPAPDVRTTAEYVAMCAWFGTQYSAPAQSCASWLRDALLDAATLANLDINALLLARLALGLADQSMGERFAHELEISLRRGVCCDAIDQVAGTYLAIFDQLPYDVHSSPLPEFVCLPSWAPASLASHDRWSRSVRVPISILVALAPRKRVLAPLEQLQDLRGRRHVDEGISVPQRLSLGALRALHAGAFGGMRQRALRRATRWIVARVTAESGVAGCMSATALAAIALSCVGYDSNSPVLARCFAALDRCQQPDGGIAARPAPTRLTAQAISSLAACNGHASSAAVSRAVEALLAREVLRRGDWSDSKDVDPGGWSAEYNNERYPDVACTAAALVALRATFASSPASSLVADHAINNGAPPADPNAARPLTDQVSAASRRARRWLVAMQRVDGCWSSSDRSWNWYASAQFDEGHLSAATTGLVLQALGSWEVRVGQAAVDRAVSYLRDEQDESGIWRGGGVFDLYATWRAIEGLSAVGVDAHDPAIRRAAKALGAWQNDDGSFGFRKALHCCGSTVCTSWALLAMIAANQPQRTESMKRAAAWLAEHQLPGGTWRIENSAIFSTLGPHTVSDMNGSLYAFLAVTRYCNPVIGRVHDPQLSP